MLVSAWSVPSWSSPNTVVHLGVAGRPVVERGTIAAQDQPIALDDELLLRPWRLDDAGAARAAFSDVAI